MIEKFIYTVLPSFLFIIAAIESMMGQNLQSINTLLFVICILIKQDIHVRGKK